MKPLLLVLLLAEVVIGNMYDYYQSNHVFAAEFYKKALAPHVKESFSFSPAALQALLAVVAMGAQGETKKQLLEVAQLPEDGSKIGEIYRYLHEKLSQMESNTLPFLAVYVGKLQLNPIYEAFLKDIFKTYITDTTRSLGIPRNPFSANIFVFSNGVVFKYQLLLDVLWETRFNKTHPLMFYLNYKDETTIEMLHVKKKLNYYNDEVIPAEFVQIPIIDKELTLTLVLSDVFTLNLERYMAHLLSDQPYEKLDVSVTFPNFLISKSHDIVSNLASLGLTIPFSNESEFRLPFDTLEVTKEISETGEPIITTRRKSPAHVKIIKGTHKTVIDLTKAISEDEQSSYITLPPLEQQTGKNFIANRPFMYYVKHSVLGVVAMGRYMGP